MRIFLAGHKGMAGSAILTRLTTEGHDILTRNRNDLDLTEQSDVRNFLRTERPDAVILAAAKVGGIHANNSFPADFIYTNLAIQINLIHESFRCGVEKLLFLGSSCIYPRNAPQPLAEDALLTGALEPTNEPYAIAKIAGIKLCESYNRQHGTDYRSVMPTNLYGPGDNFHPANSHVLPALLRRFHEATQSNAEEVTVWGSGTPRREFLHVNDLADASLFVMNLPGSLYAANTLPMQSHLNVGSGSDISIRDLAEIVASVTGFRGKITFDPSKPDGTPRKLLDTTKLSKLGWAAKTDLQSGIESTYKWFLDNIHCFRET